jgi:hypothetical protein
MMTRAMEVAEYPDRFDDFLSFLCEKYHVDRSRLFVEYSSRPPPPLKGTRAGYYEGLLSFREKDGHTEFLITVFKLSPEPLLTLAHEFAHLVKNLKSGNFAKHLRPPDDETERMLDSQAMDDMAEFQALDRSIAGSER